MSEKGKVSPFPCFRAHEGTQVNQNLSRPVRSTGLAEPGEPAREMERTGVIMFIHILPCSLCLPPFNHLFTQQVFPEPIQCSRYSVRFWWLTDESKQIGLFPSPSFSLEAEIVRLLPVFEPSQILFLWPTRNFKWKYPSETLGCSWNARGLV